MKALNVIFGILWLILGNAILIKTYFWFPLIADIFTETFPLVLYWISTITMVTIIIYIIPFYLILTGLKKVDINE